MMGLVALTPNTADACGGLFCDGGPTPMPVDQTGENVVFIPDQDSIEVQIQIQYMGEASQFAWVIPVLSIPTEFNVGSELLFDSIMNASVPTYGITVQQDVCDAGTDDGFPGNGLSTAAGGSSGGDEGDSDTDSGPNVVISEKPVGAFAITVLEGGTAEELVEWLDENGYQQDEEAVPIFEEYLQTTHAFVAIKLQNDASVDEIHPISLKFDHTEPCVPLKLTRIAAVDDMEVRTYFLSESRVVPQNFKHVLVNPLKIDWPNQAINYKDVIRQAVDADMANGRAWVTEYAGPSDIVFPDGLVNPAWDPDAFVGIDAVAAVQLFKSQGLLACQYDWQTDADICQGTHPMVASLLAQFVLPADVDANAFYNDPASFAEMIDPAQYGTGEELAALIEERIVAPGQHAAQVLADNDYLTRMYTIISPHEMIEDPMFHENPDLEDVPNVRTGTRRILCNGDSLWTLPDGREVYVPANATWPDIGGDAYWEEEVSEVPPVGAPFVLVNNTEAINGLLATYNAEVGWDGSNGNGGAESGDDGGDSAGCGCRGGGPASALWAMGLLVGLGLMRRRNR
jgi:MYXO-CTERM domain-containing protein